jgi:hypothetical protein
MAIQTVKTGAAVNDGTGDDARTAFTKINQNFTDSANAASRQVGTAPGNVMEVGAFGLGSTTSANTTADINILLPNRFISVNSNTTNGSPISYGLGYQLNGGNSWQVVLLHDVTTSDVWISHRTSTDAPINFKKLLSTGNTSTDSNGFVKAASPIVSLYADKIECNDEAKLQPITFEKLGIGDYLIKGSLGFAQEGWYIEMPKDANGNVLVAVVYEQLENNDISVKTYDYMLNKKGRIVPDLETPLDIPETRWIDLRLQALPQADIKPFNNYETAILDA